MAESRIASVALTETETASRPSARKSAANGFALVEIPFDKTGPKPADYALYFQALEKAEGPFYIHCKGGSHRAGILGAAYRMKSQDWPVEKSLIEYGRLGGDLKTDHAMTETLQTLSTQ